MKYENDLPPACDFLMINCESTWPGLIMLCMLQRGFWILFGNYCREEGIPKKRTVELLMLLGDYILMYVQLSLKIKICVWVCVFVCAYKAKHSWLLDCLHAFLKVLQNFYCMAICTTWIFKYSQNFIIVLMGFFDLFSQDLTIMNIEKWPPSCILFWKPWNWNLIIHFAWPNGNYKHKNLFNLKFSEKIVWVSCSYVA